MRGPEGLGQGGVDVGGVQAGGDVRDIDFLAFGHMQALSFLQHAHGVRDRGGAGVAVEPVIVGIGHSGFHNQGRDAVAFAVLVYAYAPG